METIRSANESVFTNGPGKDSVGLALAKIKNTNPLKIVESGDVSGGAVTGEKTSPRMDSYKELELYLAKVNVSISLFISIFFLEIFRKLQECL